MCPTNVSDECVRISQMNQVHVVRYVVRYTYPSGFGSLRP